MWPFIESDDGDEEIGKVPVSALFRWFLYDVASDDANSYATTFNLSAVSPEGDEKERNDSDDRVDKINPLYSFLSLYATINAQYTFEAQKDELLKLPGINASVLDSEGDAIKNFYRNMTFAGLLSSYAAAVELGLVKLNGSFTGLS